VTDRYFAHVTLTTSHVRRSYRSEVADEALDVVGRLLAEALDGRDPVIPGLVPRLCTLQVVGEGRCMSATVLSPYDEETGGLQPLVTIGVATHSRCGAALWRPLHQGEVVSLRDEASPPPCPPEPWCAARIEPALAFYGPETALALGDFERCLAWAWIARCEAH
jgi:hypothetical protein